MVRNAQTRSKLRFAKRRSGICVSRSRPPAYIVTTGNELVLETSDFIDYMLDDGETHEQSLLLIEAGEDAGKKIQTRCRKGARGGEADYRRQDRSDRARVARSGFAYRGVGRRRRCLPRHFRALRPDRRTRFRRNARPRRRLPCLRQSLAGGKPRRNLHGIRPVLVSGWLTLAPRRGSMCRCWMTRRVPRSMFTCRPMPRRRISRFHRAGRAEARLRAIRAAGRRLPLDRQRHCRDHCASFGLLD